MKIEDQVVSLEQAQKLKELGFERDSCFYYYHNEILTYDNISDIGENVIDPWKNVYPAYTTSEIMEILPYILEDSCYQLTILKVETRYSVSFRDENWDILGPNYLNNNLVQTLGDMLIFLINNGYIKNE